MPFYILMKKALFITTICALGWLILVVFVPGRYDISPGKELKPSGTWDLSTGSKISYYKLEGSRACSPVLYIHGGPGGNIHRDLVSTLMPLSYAGHTVYFYDQFGSGHSGRAQNIREYTVGRHTEDLAEIIKKIADPGVILLAHSWGAVLTANYLCGHHDLVEKVILSGPGHILPADPARKKLTPPDSLHLLPPQISNREINRTTGNLRTKLITWLATRLGIKMAGDKEMDRFFALWNARLSRSTVCDTANIRPLTTGGGFYSHIMTVRDFARVRNRKSGLKTCHTPVLILRGQCDNQSWGFTQEYLELFPDIHLEIIGGAGHAIAVEQPEKYLEKIVAFIK